MSDNGQPPVWAARGATTKPLDPRLPRITFLRMFRRVTIPAALAFIGFFITIIVIANRGEGENWWAFLEQIPYGDKLGHLGLVGTLSLLCNLGFHTRQPKRLPRGVTWVTFVLFVLLSAEEASQAFLPHRTCDFGDWLADLAGLAVGQFCAGSLKRLGGKTPS